jgi:hypothetical protein
MRFTLSYFLLVLSMALVAFSAPVPEALADSAPVAEAGVEAASSTLEKRGYSGR